MAGHVFSEIFLHYNWHTLSDAPLLTPATEQFVHNYIRNRCRETKGVYYHEIGGTETHIHLVIRIEPFVAIDKLAGEIKGASSHETNEHLGRKVLEWQRGYGVVSFSHRQLEGIIEYVRRQKEHHAKGSVISRLEATNDGEGSPAEGAEKRSRWGHVPPPEGGGKQHLKSG